MTDAEKDAAWRSLPEVDKAAYRRIYHREANTGVESYGRGYRDALADVLGKHNLTATEDEKPRKTDIDGKFHLGDKVVTTAYCLRYERGAIGEVVCCHESDVDVAFGLRVVPHVALCDLEHYTEEQELKEETLGKIANDDADWAGDELPINKTLPGPYKIGDLVRFSYGYFCNLIGVVADYHKEVDEYSIRELVPQNSSKLSVKSSNIGAVLTEKEPTRSGDFKQHHNSLSEATSNQEPEDSECVDSPSSLQNEIPSMSKEDAEELAKCLDELNNSINKFKGSQVDWLAYRMELAKEISSKLIVALSDGGLSSDYCQSVIDETATIVDGIVERLKGGEK